MTIVYSEGTLLRVDVELEGGCFFRVEYPLPPESSVLGDSGREMGARDLPDMDEECLMNKSYSN